jgi:hypothetical protein
MACSWVASARKQAHRFGKQIYETNRRPADAQRLRQAWTGFKHQFHPDEEEIILSYLDAAFQRGKDDARRARG